MIRNEQILSAIEKHLVKAKTAPTNSEMREQLVAMKALCDVLLMNDRQTSLNNPVQHVQQVQSTQSMPSQPISSTNTLQENDGANGDSIFDF